MFLNNQISAYQIALQMATYPLHQKNHCPRKENLVDLLRQSCESLDEKQLQCHLA